MTHPVTDWVTCTCGKRAYFDKRTARDIRRRMSTHGLHIYRCPDAGHWHLGHQAPGATRADYRARLTGAS